MSSPRRRPAGAQCIASKLGPGLRRGDGPRMKVIILGAGVAGMASAWYFWRDGHEVTVLERNTGAALETRFANGGQLSYSYVAPVAIPSVIPKIPPWLLRRDSSLRFWPELDPDQWSWCLEFLAA